MATWAVGLQAPPRDTDDPHQTAPRANQIHISGWVGDSWQSPATPNKSDPLNDVEREHTRFKIVTPLEWPGKWGLAAWIIVFSLYLLGQLLAHMNVHTYILKYMIGQKADQSSALVETTTDESPAQVCPEWGLGPSEPEIPAEPLHELLVMKWASSPAPALWLEGEDEAISYEALLGSAAQLAQKLVQVSWPGLSRPGEAGNAFLQPRAIPVLARTEDGYTVVVGSLGIMMAGYVFAPLAVEGLPEERVQWILDEISAPVALVSEASKEIVQRLPRPPSGLLVVQRDAEIQRKVQFSRDGLPVVSSSSAMSLFWTSGSTGKPKGVLVPFSAALSHYVSYFGHFEVGRCSTVLRTTAIHFDVTYSVVFGALLHGACVVWPKSQVLVDPAMLASICADYSVSFLVLMPSVTSLFIEHERFPPCVKHVGSCGEQLHSSLATRLVADVEGPILHNRYGPTECGNISTLQCRVDMKMCSRVAIPIGRPCAHRVLHIVPPENSTSAALEGELWISGPGLATGYYGRKDLTDTAFVALPAAAKGPLGYTGQRSYTTGDLVRWTSEKQLCFIGRKDLQVKLRGQRVELGEIEAVLKQFTGVTEAVVMIQAAASAAPGGDCAIAAFVSPKKVDVESLAIWVVKHVPTFMVPDVFHLVDSWPRNSNGKLDRRALQTMLSSGDSLNTNDTFTLAKEDSLGMLRLQRGSMSLHEDLVLSNVRCWLLILICINHLGLNPKSDWSPQVSDFRHVLMWLITNVHNSADSTMMLIFVVGYRDAREHSANKFTRDLIVFFAAVVFFLTPDCPNAPPFWWALPFLCVRIVAAGGVLWRRIGFTAWLGSLLWWPPSALHWFGNRHGWDWNCFAFVAMYWMGLEFGPYIQKFGQTYEFGFHAKSRYIWGGCATVVYFVSEALVLRAHVGKSLYYDVSKIAVSSGFNLRVIAQTAALLIIPVFHLVLLAVACGCCCSRWCHVSGTIPLWSLVFPWGSVLLDFYGTSIDFSPTRGFLSPSPGWGGMNEWSIELRVLVFVFLPVAYMFMLGSTCNFGLRAASWCVETVLSSTRLLQVCLPTTMAQVG